MKKFKTNIVSFFGSLAAFIPFLGACPGAACTSCGGACITPVISIFGISLNGFFSSNLWNIMQPILIAISGVLFTIAYFSIYKNKPTNNHCNSPECKLNPLKKEKSVNYSKNIFWFSLVISVSLFTYTIINNNFNQEISINKSKSISKQNSVYGFFDVDCLYWDENSKSLACKKGRVEPISEKVYTLHKFASKKNIPMLFTTCCSANMPTKTDMKSAGMLFIPLDSIDNSWKSNVEETQTFYIAKNAYGNPKMNYDKRAVDMFKDNKNINSLLDVMGIKNWIVFGDAFELCTVSAINGLLDRGYKVTVLEDVIISSHSGDENQRKQILEAYKKRGIIVKKFDDIINSEK
jgi:nicotinamidase-related amidase